MSRVFWVVLDDELGAQIFPSVHQPQIDSSSTSYLHLVSTMFQVQDV